MNYVLAIVLCAAMLTVSFGEMHSPFLGLYSDPNHPDCYRKIIETKMTDKLSVYGQDNINGEGVSCKTDDKSQLDVWGPCPALINNITQIIVPTAI